MANIYDLETGVLLLAVYSTANHCPFFLLVIVWASYHTTFAIWASQLCLMLTLSKENSTCFAHHIYDTVLFDTTVMTITFQLTGCLYSLFGSSTVWGHSIVTLPICWHLLKESAKWKSKPMHYCWQAAYSQSALHTDCCTDNFIVTQMLCCGHLAHFIK